MIAASAYGYAALVDAHIAEPLVFSVSITEPNSRARTLNVERSEDCRAPGALRQNQCIKLASETAHSRV